MTPWRFKGATNHNRCKFASFRIGSVIWWRRCRRGGCGEVRRGPAWRAGGRRPQRRAAAAGWGWASGLIQQAWTRSSSSRHLVVDLGAKPGQAAEGRLHMAARAAKPVVKVEVAESGIEIVAPHQADHPAAEPDAFGVAGRAIDGLGGLGKFVGLALVVLGGSAALAARLAGLSWVAGVPLWASAPPIRSRQGRERRNGAKPQNNSSTRRRINSPICSCPHPVWTRLCCRPNGSPMRRTPLGRNPMTEFWILSSKVTTLSIVVKLPEKTGAADTAGRLGRTPTNG